MSKFEQRCQPNLYNAMVPCGSAFLLSPVAHLERVDPLACLQHDNNDMQEPIRKRRSSHKLLHRRTHQHNSPMQHRRRQHRIPPTRKHRRQYLIQCHTQCIRLP